MGILAKCKQGYFWVLTKLRNLTICQLVDIGFGGNFYFLALYDDLNENLDTDLVCSFIQYHFNQMENQGFQFRQVITIRIGFKNENSDLICPQVEGDYGELLPQVQVDLLSGILRFSQKFLTLLLGLGIAVRMGIIYQLVFCVTVVCASVCAFVHARYRL